MKHDDIAANFTDHKISRVQQAKSWRVQKPGTWIYGFTITWSPGVLALAGDVNELIVYHAHALASFESTMRWLDRIDFDYFMSKTNAKEVFSREASVELITKLANAEAEANEDAPRWRELFSHYSYLLPAGQEDPLNPEHRAALAQILKDDHELDEGAIYELHGDPELIVYTWTTQHLYQFEAIQSWHRLMKAHVDKPSWFSIRKALLARVRTLLKPRLSGRQAGA